MARRATRPENPSGLYFAREFRQISQDELVRRSGVSKGQVSKLESSKRKLTREWAEKFAKPLELPAERILFWDKQGDGDKPQRPKTSGRISGRPQNVPLLSSVPAGRLWASEGVTIENARKTLITSGLPEGDWLALEVEGDSMDRIAPDGSTIFVNRSDKKLVKDRFYVFATEEGESTFKRYRPGPDRLLPFSTNPDHEPIALQGQQFFVVGRARRVLVDL